MIELKSIKEIRIVNKFDLLVNGKIYQPTKITDHGDDFIALAFNMIEYSLGTVYRRSIQKVKEIFAYKNDGFEINSEYIIN